MKKTIYYLLLILAVIFLISCNEFTAKKDDNEQELLISAAISMTDALEEIKHSYEKESSVKLTFNLGGSGSLTQQIEQGAPVDIFISANDRWMNELEKEGFLLPDSKVNLIENQLVLIGNESTSISYQSFSDFSPDQFEQIAIGNPDSVPAGEYAVEAFTQLGMYEEIKDKLIFAKDVRQVLTYVESGNVEIGFVYQSDAQNSERVKIITNAEQGLHEPIIYPAAIMSDTKNEKAARDFIQFMMSDTAQNIFKKYGFTKNRMIDDE